jgi:hypothetical protein
MVCSAIKSPDFRPEKFQRVPKLPKQIIKFQGINLTPDCCISETAFPVKSLIIGSANWMGLAAETPERKAPRTLPGKQAGELK